jgi:hypothetical protein
MSINRQLSRQHTENEQAQSQTPNQNGAPSTSPPKMNPFGKPPRNVQLSMEYEDDDQEENHSQQYFDDPNVVPDNQRHSTLPTNPYDKAGAPGLATNFVDINCDCVKHIRTSRCDLPFQSFASCHNAVLQATMKRNAPPMFFQCEGHYARMMICMQKIGLEHQSLVERPEVDTVYVRGL